MSGRFGAAVRPLLNTPHRKRFPGLAGQPVGGAPAAQNSHRQVRATDIAQPAPLQVPRLPTLVLRHDGALGTMEAAVELDPVEEPCQGQRIPTQSEGETERSAHKPRSEPEVEDDGTVPEKQLSRWIGEGGSWRPVEWQGRTSQKRNPGE